MAGIETGTSLINGRWILRGISNLGAGIQEREYSASTLSTQNVMGQSFSKATNMNAKVQITRVQGTSLLNRNLTILGQTIENVTRLEEGGQLLRSIEATFSANISRINRRGLLQESFSQNEFVITRSPDHNEPDYMTEISHNFTITRSNRVGNNGNRELFEVTRQRSSTSTVEIDDVTGMPTGNRTSFSFNARSNEINGRTGNERATFVYSVESVGNFDNDPLTDRRITTMTVTFETSRRGTVRGVQDSGVFQEQVFYGNGTASSSVSQLTTGWNQGTFSSLRLLEANTPAITLFGQRGADQQLRAILPQMQYPLG